MTGAFQSTAFQADAFQRSSDGSATLAARMEGAYSASASVDVAVSGDLETQQVGAYQANADIDVIVRSPGAFQGTAFQLGAFQRADQTSATLHAQIGGGYSASVSGEVDIVGDLDADAPGPYVSAIHGGPIAASVLSVRQVGSYAAAAVIAVTVAASLTAQIVGSYAAAVSAKVPVVGHLATQQVGAYQSGTSGVVKVAAALTAQQTGAYNDQFVADVEDGYLRVRMVGAYGAALNAGVRVDTALAVQQVNPYTAASDIDVEVHGGLAVQQVGAYRAQFGSVVKVAGGLEVQQVGAYKFNATGSSSAYVPRDPALGLIYLVEIDGYKDGAVTRFRFGTEDFNTRPADNPANEHYAGRINVPGNFSRSLFSSGTTNGQAEVGYGAVVLNNTDGALDELEGYAFDGRKLKILSMERRKPIYTRALTVFEGTMAQAAFTLDKVTFQLRDRLAELDRSVQTALYAGTTTAGGMNEAEGGPDDLKNQPKPLAFGSSKNVGAVNSNTFDLIYDLGSNGLQSVAEVRDKGVALTPTGNDYSTVAALRTATIASGRYATALNLGLIRTGSKPVGQLTASPVQGANAAARTAAQVARSILLRMGMTENVDFLAGDVVALDAVNSAVVGLWTGTSDVTALSLVSQVLNSIGASISPDRTGIYRMVRLALPSGEPEVTITDIDILDDGRIEKLATGDQGKGVPAWKVSVRYAQNYTVMSAADLDPVNTTAAFRAFAEQEWRIAVASDEDVLAAHPLATEITIDTCLQDEAAAQAMAEYWLSIYSEPRKRYRVTIKSVYVERVDLGSVVRLQYSRFGMGDGRIFRVIGLVENYETTKTILDLWG